MPADLLWLDADACLSTQDVLNDALVVGEALGMQQQAAAAVASLQQRMDTAKALVAQLPPVQHPKVRVKSASTDPCSLAACCIQQPAHQNAAKLRLGTLISDGLSNSSAVNAVQHVRFCSVDKLQERNP